MPNKFITLDTTFPTFSEGSSTTEKIDSIMSYLYQQQESLRYMLRHLDSSNFDEDGINSLTEPISISLREDFNEMQLDLTASGIEARLTGIESSLALKVSADQLNSTIAALDDDFSQINQTINGISTTVSEQNGKISNMQQTVDGFTTTVSDQNKKISSMQQTVDGFEATVGDLSTGLAQTVRIASDGVTITNASGSTLTIDGGQLKAGSVTANAIAAGTITADEIAANTITSAEIAAGSINADRLNVTTLTASKLKGNSIDMITTSGYTVGNIGLSYTSTGYGVSISTNYGGIKLEPSGGNIWLSCGTNKPSLLLGTDNGLSVCSLTGGAFVLGSQNYGSSLPSSPHTGQVYFLLA